MVLLSELIVAEESVVVTGLLSSAQPTMEIKATTARQESTMFFIG